MCDQSSPPKSAKSTSSAPRAEDVTVWLRWAVSPLSAAHVLVLPPLLALPTHFILPHLPPSLQTLGNPFTPFFLLSHAAPPPTRISASHTTAEFLEQGGQVYVKGPADLLLLAWSIIFFSLLRLLLTNHALPALAHYYGIRKPGKVSRFGEQGYAVVYFAVVGALGIYVMSTSRTWWFDTQYFWRDYPHTHMSAAMKRYYLSQIAYWLQQALVLLLGLEAPRSDYRELALHHLITVWMVSWSYLMSVTLLGNAVFVSMDIPDLMLAFSKMLNYLNLERAKVVSFGVFVAVWTYFRHYLSLRILWSLQYEFDYVPKPAQIFSPLTGLYMAPWMRDQMFYTLCILQLLNIFWYYLIWRVLIRSIMTSETDDNRSDPEEEEEAGAGEIDLDDEMREKGPLVGVDSIPCDGENEKKTGAGARSWRSKGKTRGSKARVGAGQGLSAVANANGGSL